MLVGTKIIWEDRETTIANVWASGKYRKYLLADGREILVEPGKEHELMDTGRLRVLSNNSPLKVPVEEPRQVLPKVGPSPKAIPPAAKQRSNWGGDQHEHE
jgi:hypothetical protein